MKKRMFAFATVACLLAALLAGCAGGGTPDANAPAPDANKPAEDSAPAPAGDSAPAPAGSSTPVRVLVAGWLVEDGIDAATGHPYKGLATWFKENFDPVHPEIEYELNMVPWDTCQQKQQAELMAQNVDVLYVGSYVSQFYSMGLLRNIDDLLEADTDYKPLEIFPEGVWNTSYNVITFDKEHRYGLPATLGQRYTMYDKQLFDEWGVEYLSAKPTTDEILTKAKQMTGINPVTGEQNYGIWFDITMPIDVFTFVAWSYAFGVDGGTGVPNDPKNIQWNLNDPKMAQLFEAFGELVTYTPPGFITGLGNELFGEEGNTVAMWLDGNGSKIMGEYFQSQDDAMINRFEAALNVGPDGEGWVAVDPIVMAANPGNLEASWEVMKALASPERQQYYYEDFRWVPAVQDSSFVDPKDKFMRMAIEVAGKARYTLVDESVPFYTLEMVPMITDFAGQILEGKTVDIPAMLDNLQNKAVEWSNAQS